MSEEATAATIASVLGTLADLATSADASDTGLVVPLDWFRWLPIRAAEVLAPNARSVAPREYPDGIRSAMRGYDPQAASDGEVIDEGSVPYAAIDRKFAERLAAVDQVRLGQRSLRIGWLFVAGRFRDPAGRSRRVFHPLVTVPVRVHRPAIIGDARLVVAGDVELSERVRSGHRPVETGGGAFIGEASDVVDAAMLARLPKLRRFAIDTASSAGFTVTDVIASHDHPDDLIRHDGLRVVAGCAVYAVTDDDRITKAGTLRAWPEPMLRRWTAFHSAYLGVDGVRGEHPLRPNATELDECSAFVLTPAQRDACRRSVSNLLSVISGAPGTGKSHTIAAVAHRVLADRRTVLVAAKSDATVDALIDLLARVPGPDPVVFGSSERRHQLAARLAAGRREQHTSDEELDHLRRGLGELHARETELRRSIRADLAADDLRYGAGSVQQSRSLCPGFFESTADLGRARELLDEASRPSPGLFGAWRASRRRRRLSRMAGADVAAVGIDACRRALSDADAVRAAEVLAADGGLEIGDRWDVLAAAEAATRRSTGELVAADAMSAWRLGGAPMGAVGALATALRSGRGARRAQLAQLNESKLTTALPLWIGTLADIDDLLPPVAGLFDVVILDEASAIDQPLAAPALLRGQAGVVVGDPRQLRHVSFVSDERIADAVAGNGVAEPLVAARLDVRRNSVFDVAAGSSRVTELDEHFRCNPHLVEFVAHRLYSGHVHVATRSPLTESADCVDVRRVAAKAGTDKSVRGEVDAVMSELFKLSGAGARSVGVVTPFRAQADALEAAILAGFGADDLERMDLRVGTVHQFQGNERDVVIASLGIAPDAKPGTWSFVEDSHLLTVFLTRARERLVLIYSADPPADSTLAEFIAESDSPPGRPRPRGTAAAWTQSIAADLTRAGLDAAVSYPSGRHVVDIAIGGCDRPIAIECTVHPDGPDAHIERHLALVRAGWKIFEAFESKWGDLQADLVVDLVGRIRDLAPAESAN